ncbi:MAG: hypothetical protein IIV01_03095 [Bacteroidaceae bacterium]|nr:hypothetical protein [Bacteroidaceae bacterium]
MNTKSNLELLKCFMSGESTMDEERELASLLMSEDCPIELRDKRLMLLPLLPDVNTETLPRGFGQRLHGVLKGKEQASMHTKKRVSLMWRYVTGGIAACIVALCPLLFSRESDNGVTTEVIPVPTLEDALLQDARHREAMETEVFNLISLNE